MTIIDTIFIWTKSIHKYFFKMNYFPDFQPNYLWPDFVTIDKFMY